MVSFLATLYSLILDFSITETEKSVNRSSEIIIFCSVISYRCIEHVNEVIEMKGVVEERATLLGEYILQNNATVRSAAKRFHISKSTVHKDVAERLQTVNPQLYGQVRHVLEENKAQRHIRGGQATKRKYKGE